MKTIITAAILATAVATSAAQERREITTPEGQITLLQAHCTNAPGKEAVMILNRDGGAYGCWVTTQKNVVITWHTLLGANGSILYPRGYVTTHPKN